MKKKTPTPKNLKYISTAIIIFTLDQCFKDCVENWSATRKQLPLAGRFLTLRKHHNRGLPMNIAEEHQGKIAKVSLITTIIMSIYFAYVLFSDGKPLEKAGLSLEIGGAFSNTYDRLNRKYVVDYFSFNYPEFLKKIVFNIGDIAIFVGAFLTLLSSLFTRKKD